MTSDVAERKLPSGWKSVPFPKAVRFQEGPGVRNWQFRTAGIKLVNVRNIVDGELVLSNTERHLDPEEVKTKYRHFLLDEGDMVLSSSGVTWGKIAEVKKEHLPLCLNTSMIRILPLDTKLIDRGFLRIFIESRFFRSQIIRLITGSAQPNFGPSHLERVEIPLPPLAEQQRIAEVLDRAEALRAKRRAALAQLDSLTQSLFLDLFGDPATNPKRMRKEPLGNLIKLKSGEFLPAAEMAESGAYPVLGGNGINGFHDRYMFEAPKIVIGRVGVYCGCVHVSPLNSWVTDNALYVSERSEDVTFDYLFHALTHARLNQYASQSGQPLISGSRIYPVQILIPLLPLQNEFARRVAGVEKLKTAQRASLAELDALFSSLQHRAFRGEL